MMVRQHAEQSCHVGNNPKTVLIPKVTVCFCIK